MSCTPKIKKITFKDILIFVFIFSCFFPYLARSIGKTTGLQIGELIAIIGLFIGFPNINKKVLKGFILLWLPSIISFISNLLFYRAIDEMVMIKSFVFFSIVLSVLLFSGIIVNLNNWKPILYGSIIAIIIQSIFGAIQYYFFRMGIFPFRFLFELNPGLSAISKVAFDHAIYNKRIFGWFPEPSAMAAALGPWLILIIIIFMNKLKEVFIDSWILLIIAFICGTTLIIASASGYILFLILSIVIIILSNITKIIKNRKNIILSLVMIMPIFISIYLGWEGYGKYYQNRFIFNQNLSWLTRYESILSGLELLTSNLGNFFIGVGPGQSFLNLLETSPICSVMFNYFTETGIIGIISFIALFFLIISSIYRGKKELRIPGLACFISWIGGVFFSTSYYDLLSIWVFLSILILWEELFI